MLFPLVFVHPMLDISPTNIDKIGHLIYSLTVVFLEAIQSISHGPGWNGAVYSALFRGCSMIIIPVT